ncbi:MAG: ferritin-like domain-containing protein [Thermodesulfobacteriota bacterium]
MTFKAILKDLVERSPGAIGAIMIDHDGETVANYTATTYLDLPAIGAHQGVILQMVKRVMAGRSTKEDAQHIGISTNMAKIAISTIQDGYSLVLLIKKNSFLGKAFMESRKTVAELEHEIGCPVDQTIERIRTLEHAGAKEARRTRLIEELNKDLEWEYASAIQYIQHAVTATGPQFDSIKRKLLTYSHDEMEHAAILSDQIHFLGGAPTTNVEIRVHSLDSLDMVRHNLRAKDSAIDRYKGRIAEAEALCEYGLRRLLEDILLKEEEHKRVLLTAIGA